MAGRVYRPGMGEFLKAVSMFLGVVLGLPFLFWGFTEGDGWLMLIGTVVTVNAVAQWQRLDART